MKTNRLTYTLFLAFLFSIFSNHVFAQPEVMAWGNLTGIRIQGQLMEFETSLCTVEKNWKNIQATGKEKQRPKYLRDGIKQTVNTKIGGISFSQIVEDRTENSAKVTIQTTSEVDSALTGVFFRVNIPQEIFQEGIIKFGNNKPKKLQSFDNINPSKPFQTAASKIVITSDLQELTILMDSKTKIFVKNGTDTELFIALMGTKVKKGQNSKNTFIFQVTGNIDNSPAELVLDATNPGRQFLGLGGNFRLQNAKTDPQVIQYCLDNIRVAYGRVEMPWMFWHAEENTNPLEAAKNGDIHPRVHAAMVMAQRLAKKGMPVIVSDWSAPDWTIIGEQADAYRFRNKGIFGYPLNSEKADKIYQSIGDYLVLLKQKYGVEAVAFSFNESDLGINVRHTGDEHATFIKGLGAHLASRGLATKLLLGDNSDATTFDFILPALNDPETHKYISAISFHSWRGCTNEILKQWAGASKKLNVPLIVGEGSTDAAAWNYPDIFSEESFALYEINLYTRLLAICQPLTILQWQLTADYSVLIGNGVFGTEGKLRPTQRFWNLKQLASTPENAFVLPLSCNKQGINCAAAGNIATGQYVIHMVNNGAECETTISGIPSEITEFQVYVTDKKRNMEKTQRISVSDGKAKLSLHPAGFTSLMSIK